MVAEEGVGKRAMAFGSRGGAKHPRDAAGQEEAPDLSVAITVFLACVPKCRLIHCSSRAAHMVHQAPVAAWSS
jgi:hypothetical protein